MKFIKPFLFFLIVPFFAFTSLHKYYISVTQINFIEEKQSVQITTRIFIDDFESLLRERYDESITLVVKDEPKITDIYVGRYLKERIKIKINNKEVDLTFIGKEYDQDIMRCYLEIEGINNIESFEVSNKVLFDLFKEQQNIVKTKINSKQKSFILSPKKDNALLKFN